MVLNTKTEDLYDDIAIGLCSIDRSSLTREHLAQPNPTNAPYGKADGSKLMYNCLPSPECQCCPPSYHAQSAQWCHWSQEFEPCWIKHKQVDGATEHGHASSEKATGQLVLRSC